MIDLTNFFKVSGNFDGSNAVYGRLMLVLAQMSVIESNMHILFRGKYVEPKFTAFQVLDFTSYRFSPLRVQKRVHDDFVKSQIHENGQREVKPTVSEVDFEVLAFCGRFCRDNQNMANLKTA